MKSSRSNPWKRVKTANGWKYKFDFQDLTWNIQRTRATFNTAAECEEYLKVIIANSQKAMKGEKIIRTFGEALIRYLEETSDTKLSHVDDLSNAKAIRWPFLMNGEWMRLEDLNLDDSENGIVAGFKSYIIDLKKVVKRSYIKNKIFHLRKENNSLIWYEQPSPTEGDYPKPREMVTDILLLKKLESVKGRGPFSETTFSLRQTLVKTILNCAKNDWRWTDKELSSYINEAKPNKGIINYITTKQLDCLVEEADEMFGYLILGGAYIGWRQRNLIGLTWDRVVWEQVIENNGEKIFIPGYIFIPKRKDIQLIDNTKRSERMIRTKNGDSLETIITPRIKKLLQIMDGKRVKGSNVVFHNGYGEFWGEFKKRWNGVKKRASIPPSFRWHDLRHTWATDLINHGVNKDIIKAEQGWKDDKMVDRYAHILHKSRYKALENIEMQEY
ncbi:hypothetical protein CI610_01359 [invertebrate metagenome]|uniref:Tyr recombinase domain-containing protein n=1 Tax=invertebrate metagenome TaxID=1711999 RepID=A0A2H9T8R6_9ZZZZ